MTGQPDVRARFLAAQDQALTLLGDGPARHRCEIAVRSFFAGVRGWSSPDPGALASIDAQPPFAWEGIGLSASLTGALDRTLEARPDRAALMFVGAGWARSLRGDGLDLPASFESWSEHFGLDAWLLFDGQGFASTLLDRRRGSRGAPSTSPWFDQGCGRAIYFIHGGRAKAIDWAIEGLGRARAPSLWRGVGIASRFTDGLDPPARAALRERGGRALLDGEQRGLDLLSRTGSRVPGDDPPP